MPLRWVSLLSFATAIIIAPRTEAQDATVGERVFRTNCAICHSARPGQNMVGPTLFNVVNRHSGEVPGFHYSDANRKSGLTWNSATLDRYLAGPRDLVPGTKMTFPGLKDPKQRTDLIAYLETLKQPGTRAAERATLGSHP
jgi:cytochrome c